MSYEEEAPEEEESGGGWLVTWADMMSVLLTFFIVLQAYSTISEKKFYEAVASIQRALAVPLPIRSPGNAQYSSQNLAQDFDEMIAQEDIEGISVEDFGDRVVLTLDSEMLFTIGKADITGAGRHVLQSVTGMLGKQPSPVRIEGHTCDLAVRGGEFDSNWDLSMGRALSVLKFLEGGGISPERLSAAGYGEFRPLVPNDAEASRSMNRRVEFVIEKTAPGADLLSGGLEVSAP